MFTGWLLSGYDTTAFSYERQTEILTLFDASLRSEAEHVTDISENHRVLI